MTALLYDPALALALYGGLAFIAAWSTWHDEDLRLIGGVLAFGFVLSNVIKLAVPLIHQPGPFSFVEVLVSASAFFAWGVHRSRKLIGIVVLSLVSIAANIGFAVNFPPTVRQIFLWEMTVNMCFAGECLLASWQGMAHGYRTGRFTRRLRLRRGAAQPDASHKGGP